MIEMKNLKNEELEKVTGGEGENSNHKRLNIIPIKELSFPPL